MKRGIEEELNATFGRVGDTKPGSQIRQPLKGRELPAKQLQIASGFIAGRLTGSEMSLGSATDIGWN
jgi:hypothetical protein